MERISQLIIKKFNATLTPEESAELHAWMSLCENREKLVERLLDNSSLDDEYRSECRINWQRPAEDMQRRISRIRMLRMCRRMAVAAAAVAVLFAAVIWMKKPGSDLLEPVCHQIAGHRQFKIEDITPGRIGAICSNSEGHVVQLVANDTSHIANQFIVGRQSSVGLQPENLCLEVGRGREFKIILEDSTVVWLNSESTLSYPESFGPDSRRVAVTGEAYFEVKPDKERPFYVESGGQQIRVYGTSFNIRGYRDEDAVLTTLETGLIAITRRGNEDAELFLSPGHQSRYDKVDAMVTMKTVDSEVVTGWRHGKFVFEETPLETIMRDLSRWYDFEYEFADAELKDVIFMGAVSRYTDFKTVIRILEDGGEVRFSVIDNKIMISKK